MVMVADMVVQVVLTNQVVAVMEVAGLVVMEGTEENSAGMVVDMVVAWDLIEENQHLDILVVMEEEGVVTTEVVTVWEEAVGTVVDLVICTVGHTVNLEVVTVDQVAVMEVGMVVAVLVGMVVEWVVLVVEAIEVVAMIWVVLEAEAEEGMAETVVEETVEAHFMEEEEVEEDMEVAADGTIRMEGREFHKASQSSSYLCHA